MSPSVSGRPMSRTIDVGGSGRDRRSGRAAVCASSISMSISSKVVRSSVRRFGSSSTKRTRAPREPTGGWSAGSAFRPSSRRVAGGGWRGTCRAVSRRRERCRPRSRARSSSGRRSGTRRRRPRSWAACRRGSGPPARRRSARRPRRRHPLRRRGRRRTRRPRRGTAPLQHGGRASAARPTWVSTASPAACPPVSLNCLKSSRSKTTMLISLSVATASRNASSRRSS